MNGGDGGVWCMGGEEAGGRGAEGEDKPVQT